MAAKISTPPPPSSTSSIRTPPTPRHGWADDYQPYSSRKSARVSARAQRAAQTPPPKYNSRSSLAARSPPSTGKKSSHPPNAPASPPSTGRRHNSKMTPARGRRTISASLTEDNMASAAELLGLPNRKSHVASTTSEQNAMLPTPAKTPVKRPASQTNSSINNIARNLFPVRPETVDEVMPSPKKNRKSYSGLTMDNFIAEEEAAPIQIFTDSQDRLPEVDLSEDNPFFGNAVPAAVPEPTKRSSKRRKVSVPGEGRIDVDEAIKREDGIVYVFRGKKIFRPVVEDDNTSNGGEALVSSGEDRTDASIPGRLRRPLTRSSVKPRILFPTPAQIAANEKAHTTDDEEAITDIDESIHEMETPVDDEEQTTPKAPKFAPVSPPTTMRSTRATNKEDKPASPKHDDTRDRQGRQARTESSSPFDSWSRTKAGFHNGRKRVSEVNATKSAVPSKRQRGSA